MDSFGINGAYTGDNYGESLTYAVVETSVDFQQAGVGISELQVANVTGTFSDGEKISKIISDN